MNSRVGGRVLFARLQRHSPRTLLPPPLVSLGALFFCLKVRGEAPPAVSLRDAVAAIAIANAARQSAATGGVPVQVALGAEP